MSYKKFIQNLHEDISVPPTKVVDNPKEALMTKSEIKAQANSELAQKAKASKPNESGKTGIEFANGSLETQGPAQGSVPGEKITAEGIVECIIAGIIVKNSKN